MWQPPRFERKLGRRMFWGQVPISSTHGDVSLSENYRSSSIGCSVGLLDYGQELRPNSTLFDTCSEWLQCLANQVRLRGPQCLALFPFFTAVLDRKIRSVIVPRS